MQGVLRVCNPSPKPYRRRHGAATGAHFRVLGAVRTRLRGKTVPQPLTPHWEVLAFVVAVRVGAGGAQAPSESEAIQSARPKGAPAFDGFCTDVRLTTA
jgi:hypothetical protein